MRAGLANLLLTVRGSGVTIHPVFNLFWWFVAIGIWVLLVWAIVH